MSTAIKGQPVEENSGIDYMIAGQRIGFFWTIIERSLELEKEEIQLKRQTNMRSRK